MNIPTANRRIWRLPTILLIGFLLLFMVGIVVATRLLLFLPVRTVTVAETGKVESVSFGNAPVSIGDVLTKTLSTLKKIDAHPLYVMTYFGDYDLGIDRAQALESHSVIPWACSLFAFYDDPQNALFARNFDWENNPALLLFTDPSNGYASVSMVDISYLGFDRKNLQALDTLAGRQPLMRAPRLPFDGMNEHGLTVGMAAVDGSKVPFDAKKPTVGSLRMIRLLLDRAKNTDEAIKLFHSYNIDFSGGPQIHYLVADPNGASAVIELKDGKVEVIHGNGAWQTATNFYLTGSTTQSRQQDFRFYSLNRSLENLGSSLDGNAAMQLLQSVAQPHTRWSIIYGMSTGKVQIAMSKHFEKVYEFNLKMK